jgi:hypothetical protein
LSISAESSASALLLNTGSWAALPFSLHQIAFDRTTFPFVQINQAIEGQKPEATIFLWNDALQQVELAS